MCARDEFTIRRRPPLLAGRLLVSCTTPPPWASLSSPKPVGSTLGRVMLAKLLLPLWAHGGMGRGEGKRLKPKEGVKMGSAYSARGGRGGGRADGKQTGANKRDRDVVRRAFPGGPLMLSLHGGANAGLWCAGVSVSLGRVQLYPKAPLCQRPCMQSYKQHTRAHIHLQMQV